MRKFFKFTAMILAMMVSSGAAKATSGPGCLNIVNVASWDVLNIRAKPSATSRSVFGIDPINYGVIKLRGACIPRRASWGSRWCPITYYGDRRRYSGFVKARFVKDSDCP